MGTNPVEPQPQSGGPEQETQGYTPTIDDLLEAYRYRINEVDNRRYLSSGRDILTEEEIVAEFNRAIGAIREAAAEGSEG